MKTSQCGVPNPESIRTSVAGSADRDDDDFDGSALGSQLEDIVCPICRRRVFSCSESVVRLKTRILVFEGDSAYAKCKYCRNDVLVPLVMHEDLGAEWLPVWTEGLDGKTR